MKIDDIPIEDLTASLLATVEFESDQYHNAIQNAAQLLVARGDSRALYASSNKSQTFWILDGNYIAIDKAFRDSEM